MITTKKYTVVYKDGYAKVDADQITSKYFKDVNELEQKVQEYYAGGMYLDTCKPIDLILANFIDNKIIFSDECVDELLNIPAEDKNPKGGENNE